MRLILSCLFFVLFFVNKINSQRGGDCAPATAMTDLHANEVKATLLNGGDMWWDTNDGAYLAPYGGPNQQTPSSLFAGGIWMGGIDPGGNVKLAAKTYGSGSGQTDFYPGPLSQWTGTTDVSDCRNWDRFFEVTSAEVKSHLWRFEQSNYNVASIPKGVKEWPAKGNPFFEAIYGFELPSTGQGLADFYDENGDGTYNPLDGDYPAIFQEGCDVPSIPDQMIFWIFNDAGGVHTQSIADPIQMEFQVTAFAYDKPNAMGLATFYKYKIINRAVEDLRDAYFGLWMDPDLGCYTDDYIGCDTSRNMTYLYNQDAIDGQVGTNCPGGVNTFGDNVPMVGIDFFRGPQGKSDEPERNPDGSVLLDSFTLDTIFKDIELGMSSFIYYNNPTIGVWPSGSTDPQTAEEFYSYLKGEWRGGLPITFGGSGYGGTGRETKFVFPSSPDCTSNDCWSMCNAGLGEGDRRTVQSVGPMNLKPGDAKEIILGVVSTFGAELPCPSLDKLGADDDFIQAAFDNCLQFQETPDPPTVNWEVGNQYLRGEISNRDNSNNYLEKFESIDIIAPDNLPVEDRLYKFEGYKIFQIENEYVGWSNLNDPTKARLVYQTDIQNGIEEIFNWKLENGNWVSEPKVNATNTNSDFKLTFELEKDAFTGDDFENEKTVHFAALAYAHNDWQTFDSQTLIGQRTPYLEGILKISSVVPTLVPPHPGLGTVSVITRLDGVGAGRRFLDMTDEMHDIILNQNFDGTINYRGDRAPFEVRVTDPDKLGGRFELTFIDENLNDDELDGEIKWQLTNLDNPTEVFVSESDIITYEEFPDYGFAIHNRMGLEPGNNKDEQGDSENGAIGDEYVYENPNTDQWYSGIPDDFAVSGLVHPDVFNYILNEPNDPDFRWDPDQKLSKMGNGFFVPYFSCDYRVSDRPLPFITPAWTQQGGLVRQQLSQADLNNVDIVFTSDKSKWSRCIIVESSSPSLTQFGFTTEGNRAHFDVRGAPSVGKEDANGDGLPDPDGDGEGMGWFPGYAIDVETGQRLNIYFGESSIYRCDEPFFSDFLNACENELFDNNAPTGADMMWNPTDQIGLSNIPLNFQTPDAVWLAITGGQHFIYVTKQPYDGCVELREQLRTGVNPLFKARALGDITWTGLPILPEGQKLNSYADGIIPNDLTVKLRVDNPYEVYEGTNDKNGYPTYIFSTGNTISNIQETANLNPLEKVTLSPNPIYSKTDQQLTISNLPTKSHVKIFDVNGKIVTDFGQSPLTSVVWEPKGKLASGMYLVQIEHAVWGRKVLKWVCLN